MKQKGKEKSIKYSEWYIQNIEEPIREVVYRLRNSGVNTISSCGHDMTVGFNGFDPTTIFFSVFNVMNEMKIADWRIEVRQESVHGSCFPEFGILYVGENACKKHAVDFAILMRNQETEEYLK